MFPVMNIKSAAIAVTAIVVIAMAWQLRVQLKRNGELEAKLETQAQEAREAADANFSNLEVIGTLQRRLAAMIDQRRAEAAERERILDERDQELALARARADRLERERQDERIENPDCAELASLSIGEFCPSAADQLRVRSRGPRSDGDPDGS